MQLQIQPNNRSCLPTAASMLIAKYIKGHNVTDLFKGVGHDGGAIIHDDMHTSGRYRGFTTNELVSYCLSLNLAFLIFDCKPVHMTPSHTGLRTTRMSFDLTKLMLTNDLVLWGAIHGCHHAVAWNHVVQQVYDPHGSIYDFTSDCDIEFCAVLRPLK